MSHKYLKKELIALHGAAHRSSRNGRHGFSGKQTGVVLFIALIALVAMTLAAIALARSISTGNAVAGNLAFKQGATAASDRAVEAAITALTVIADKPPSFNDIDASGYYSTNQDNLDMTGSKNDPAKSRVDWDGNSCNGTTPTQCIQAAAEIGLGNGYFSRHVIHRLCSIPGASDSNNCSIYTPPDTADDGKGALCVGGCPKAFTSLTSVYYRITTRVTGPRNTTSFVETIVHF